MIPRILDMLFLSAPHLAGDDVRQRSEERRRYRFYPSHPRGWRQSLSQPRPDSKKFLSTPPARVATGSPQGLDASNAFLSTPPSRVATASVEGLFRQGYVSIHATLAGGDALGGCVR